MKSERDGEDGSAYHTDTPLMVITVSTTAPRNEMQPVFLNLPLPLAMFQSVILGGDLNLKDNPANISINLIPHQMSRLEWHKVQSCVMSLATLQMEHQDNALGLNQIG